MNKIKNNRITIYSTSDFPHGGAAENFVRQMALGLKSAGEQVNVVLIRGNYLEPQINNTQIDKDYLLFRKRFTNELFKLIELSLLIFSIPFSVLKNRFQRKTNVILLYGVEYFYLVLPFYLVGRALGINVYRVITDRYRDEGIAPIWWKNPKLFFYRLQYKYFDRFLTGIICLSKYLKENAILYGVEDSKICLIPHFIDIERFSTESANEIPFKQEKIRLGMCGTLNEGNGLFVLLKAYRLVRRHYSNIELLMAGPISDIDSIMIRETMGSDLDSVIITGKVSGAMIPKLLSSCDILINPRISGTFSEAGFPTKLGEYLATKRPVVATSVGDIRTYFTDKTELVIVKPNSSESLAEGIMYLIKNTELALQIGINGFEWASANVDYKKSAVQLVKFISNS